MAEAAGGGGPVLPEDLIISEILTRLPTKPFLRCRAVCRSWRRRLTSDTNVLLAHHRRQPSLPLVTEGDSTTEERRIDVLDHRTGERRPVLRTTGQTQTQTAANDDGDPNALASCDGLVPILRTTGRYEDDLHVLASCDGLLILLANGCLEICNPTTRQRAPLPLLHGAACISALYHHRPSGTCRVLCCYQRAEDGHAVYKVHTVGSRELRCVGEPPPAWASPDMVMVMPMMLLFHPHVVAGGRIYWQPIMLEGGNGKVNNMLAFDTMAESFHQLLSPVEGAFLELFEMNNGALGLYHHCGGTGTVDLWVLQDHQGSWSWSMNHRIKLDVLFFSLLPVLEPEGDVLVVSKREGTPGILWQHVQHISGANGSLLARYEWSAYLKLSRHRFKESLVHHDFFSMEGNAGSADQRSLFDGLTTLALVRDDNSEPR